MTKTMATLVLISTISSSYILSFCSFLSLSRAAPHFLSCPARSPSLSPLFFFLLSVSPLAFYSQRMHAFRDLLQEGCNSRSVSWWRRISAVRHAPLIEAAPPLTSSLPFTVETVVDEEGNEQLSRKWYRFKIQNEYFRFGHWIFCNFVIKPSHKL